MGTIDTLKKALDELRAQADSLRSDLKETENAIVAIERIVGSPRGQRHDEPAKPEPTEPDVPALKDATWADAAEWALREKGEPMHSLEIVKALQSAGYRANDDPAKSKLSLVGALARNARNGVRFTQLGDGMYGLREWDSAEEGGRSEELALG